MKYGMPLILVLLAAAFFCACGSSNLISGLDNLFPSQGEPTSEPVDPIDLPGPGPAKKGGLAVNLGRVNDFGQDLIFSDQFKHARPWLSHKPGIWDDTSDPVAVDNNGWVTSLKTDQEAGTLIMWTQYEDTIEGTYRVEYEGEGKLKFNLGAQLISEGPGYYLVDMQTPLSGMHLTITQTNPNNPIRNIKVFLPGTETEKPTFYPPYVKLAQPFRAVRLLEMQHIGSGVTYSWQERAKVTDAIQSTQKGVALEYLIDFANEINSHAWLGIPYWADDNFVRSFAKLVKKRLNPNLKVFVEYSNEVWNFIFPQAQYMVNQGVALGLGNGDQYLAGQQYYSKRSVEIFTIFHEVFAGDTNRVIRVLGSQTVSESKSANILSFEDAYQNTDVLAIAPYLDVVFGPEITQTTVEAMSVDDVLDLLEIDVQVKLQQVAEQAAVAQQYGVDLVAYEGGQHLSAAYSSIANPIDETLLITLFDMANKNARMGDIYKQLLTGWQDTGGSMFALYRLVGRPSKFGHWGLKNSIIEPDANAPKYKAAVEINQGQVWFEGL